MKSDQAQVTSVLTEKGETMSRWIDVDALYDFMNRANIPYNALIQEAIDFQPSISIVRCKECKYRYIFATIETDPVTNLYVCDFMEADYEANGYCHHGERSE